MDKNSVIYAINQGESDRIEFKRSFGDEVIETLCAFANSSGGTVILGIDDSANVVGISLTKESIPKWLNEIKSKTQPGIIPTISTFTIEGKPIVCFGIQEFPVKPVAYR